MKEELVKKLTDTITIDIIIGGAAMKASESSSKPCGVRRKRKHTSVHLIEIWGVLLCFCQGDVSRGAGLFALTSVKLVDYWIW